MRRGRDKGGRGGGREEEKAQSSSLYPTVHFPTFLLLSSVSMESVMVVFNVPYLTFSPPSFRGKGVE